MLALAFPLKSQNKSVEIVLEINVKTYKRNYSRTPRIH